jgi:hypothetical protein
LTEGQVIRTMLIRMTGIGTQIVALIGATAVAAGGVLGPGTDDAAPESRTALVVDAALARDGRELVDARLRGAADELRLPRTAAEARTDVRYLAASGHRLVVAGPMASAAAGAPAERASTVATAVAAARR